MHDVRRACSTYRLYLKMDMMLEFCNRGIKNYDLFERADTHEDSIGDNVDKTEDLEKNVVAAINTKLERAESHLQGLNLLYQFLPRISKESLTNNFPRWMSKIEQILKSTHDSSIEIVCQTTGALVTKCKKIPELDKNISINYVKRIIKILVQRYDQDNDGALLNLLTVLLYHYPESCARMQEHYNKIIAAGIDEVNDETIITGAKCYALLVRALERAFVHSSKNSLIVFPGNVPASCHVSHQIDLCNNLCSLLDELFQDLVSISIDLPDVIADGNTKIISLELNELSRHNLIDYYHGAQNRFTNICIYLSTLLKIGGNDRRKYALPNVILQVICKGLAITPTNLKREDDEEYKGTFLLRILPALHISLLNVLGDLVNSFQQELMPFAGTVLRLIMQTLEWTQKYKFFQDTRILTYKTLTVWLKSTGSLSGFQLIADELLPHILKDLSPPNKRIIVLSSRTRKGAKHKSKAQNSLSTQGVNEYDEEFEEACNMDLCSQVLSTVQAIITNVNFFLKQSFYIEIRNAIASSLHERYANKKSFMVSSENTEYRLQLLKTLRVLELHHHISTPPPTATAIHIFAIALSQEEDPEILEEAKLALSELRHITYPSAPSLMLPVFEPRALSPRSLRPSSPMEVVQHETIIHPSRMKRGCHQMPNNDVVADLPAPTKRQKVNEQESTDATFVPVKPSEPSSTIGSEIPTIDMPAAQSAKSQMASDAATEEFLGNEISSTTPNPPTNGLDEAVNENKTTETDEDMLMSFCDEPV